MQRRGEGEGQKISEVAIDNREKNNTYPVAVSPTCSIQSIYILFYLDQTNYLL